MVFKKVCLCLLFFIGLLACAESQSLSCGDLEFYRDNVLPTLRSTEYSKLTDEALRLNTGSEELYEYFSNDVYSTSQDVDPALFHRNLNQLIEFFSEILNGQSEINRLNKLMKKGGAENPNSVSIQKVIKQGEKAITRYSSSSYDYYLLKEIRTNLIDLYSSLERLKDLTLVTNVSSGISQNEDAILEAISTIRDNYLSDKARPIYDRWTGSSVFGVKSFISKERISNEINVYIIDKCTEKDPKCESSDVKFDAEGFGSFSCSISAEKYCNGAPEINASPESSFGKNPHDRNTPNWEPKILTSGSSILSLSEKTWGLVSSLDLFYKYATYLGEPVESHKIRWNRGENIYVDGNSQKVLNQKKLKKYPDLLAVFNSLRPMRIEFMLYGMIFIDQDKHYYPLDGNGNPMPEYGKDSERFRYWYTFLKDGKNLIVAPEGTIGSDGTNMKDWGEFFTILGSDKVQVKKFDRNDSYPKTKSIESDNHSIFVNAKSLQVDYMLVTNIEIPERSIRYIYDEYERRESDEPPTSPEESLNALLSEGFREKAPGEFWDTPYEDEGLEPFIDAGKWGYVTKSGRIRIKPKYNFASSFENGNAIIAIDSKRMAVINKQGNIIYTRNDGKTILQKFGTRLVIANTEIVDVDSYKEYHNRKKINSSLAIFDISGKAITRFDFSHIGFFKNGIAEAEKSVDPKVDLPSCNVPRWCYFVHGKEVGIIDRNGNWKENPTLYGFGYESYCGGLELEMKVSYPDEAKSERIARERRQEIRRQKVKECRKEKNAVIERYKRQILEGGGKWENYLNILY